MLITRYSRFRFPSWLLLQEELTGYPAVNGWYSNPHRIAPTKAGAILQMLSGTRRTISRPHLRYLPEASKAPLASMTSTQNRVETENTVPPRSFAISKSSFFPDRSQRPVAMGCPLHCTTGGDEFVTYSRLHAWPSGQVQLRTSLVRIKGPSRRTAKGSLVPTRNSYGFRQDHFVRSRTRTPQPPFQVARPGSPGRVWGQIRLARSEPGA